MIKIADLISKFKLKGSPKDNIQIEDQRQIVNWSWINAYCQSPCRCYCRLTRGTLLAISFKDRYIKYIKINNNLIFSYNQLINAIQRYMTTATPASGDLPVAASVTELIDPAPVYYLPDLLFECYLRRTLEANFCRLL